MTPVICHGAAILLQSASATNTCSRAKCHAALGILINDTSGAYSTILTTAIVTNTTATSQKCRLARFPPRTRGDRPHTASSVASKVAVAPQEGGKQKGIAPTRAAEACVA